MSALATNQTINCQPFLHNTNVLGVPPSILVVEDEPDLRALIDQSLSDLPAEISQADNGMDGLLLAREHPYDLIILDVQLPKLNGFDLCRQLRDANIYTPVLFLTAMRSELDQVNGLEIGGDDYITKPFSILPLQARVKALLRREKLSKFTETKAAQDRPLSFGSLTINPIAHQAHLAGKNLNLTPKEWKLLWTLACAPQRVFSREQLLLEVWGDHYAGFEHTVNSHMNRLRAKLQDENARHSFIHTVWGSGYRFDYIA